MKIKGYLRFVYIFMVRRSYLSNNRLCGERECREWDDNNIIIIVIIIIMKIMNTFLNASRAMYKGEQSIRHFTTYFVKGGVVNIRKRSQIKKQRNESIW